MSIGWHVRRASAWGNTEGVLFYKIWNGHAIQLRTQVNDMPAFEGRLTRDEVWAIVEHLKVLRAPRR